MADVRKRDSPQEPVAKTGRPTPTTLSLDLTRDLGSKKCNVTWPWRGGAVGTKPTMNWQDRSFAARQHALDEGRRESQDLQRPCGRCPRTGRHEQPHCRRAKLPSSENCATPTLHRRAAILVTREHRSTDAPEFTTINGHHYSMAIWRGACAEPERRLRVRVFMANYHLGQQFHMPADLLFGWAGESQ